MKLSGWARLWIVASVIWWGAGAFFVLPKWPEDPGLDLPLKDGCDQVLAKPEMFRDSPLILGMCEDSQRGVEHHAAAVGQWNEFMPLLVVWLVVPFAALFGGFVVKWIATGFHPAVEKSSDPKPPDSA